MNQGSLIACFALLTAPMPAVAWADVVVDWNKQLLQAVKATSTNPPMA